MNAKQGIGLVVLVAVGVLITSVAVKSQPVSATQRWEYATVIGYMEDNVEVVLPVKFQKTKIPDDVRRPGFKAPANATSSATWMANQMAKDDWEVISMSQDAGQCFMLLRRAKQ